MIKKNRLLKHFLILSACLACCIGCNSNFKNPSAVYLVMAEHATTAATSTIRDLKNDLEKVLEEDVFIITPNSTVPENTLVFILGTSQDTFINKFVTNGQVKLSKSKPGSGGGVWAINTYHKNKAIVIAGSDEQGLQYAIYDFSKDVLGVDPLEYWTGKLPQKKKINDLLNFEPKIIAPPKVPMLTYFENDVDELANYRGELLKYDWESYTEMINSLVRLRYNSIQLFDMLGRPEFFIRPEYKALKPDYQIDIDYVEKMIDYAHEKGMKIAVDFALGYQIHPMDAEKADCWKTYKADWLQAWRYYFEDTPLAKTDVFILRPRHQVWDWKYESTCGESKIEVFNEVYAAFGELVDEYKPESQKVLVCYSDGMEMWNNGFRPPKDWTVLWSDHGFGEFEHLPSTTDGYDFGTYMHAGYWLNHTVHNPYPEKVESVMKEMFHKYDADNYCLVNGQNFRPFLLNLVAYSQVCYSPDDFHADTFYKDWTEQYFSPEAAEHAVNSMKYLSEAQEGRKGYVEHLWEIREAVSYLSNAPIERPGKSPVPYDYNRVIGDVENVERINVVLKKAITEAKLGYEKLGNNDNFYHSYVLLPAQLYSDLIAFETSLHKMAQLKKQFENTKDKQYLKEAISILPAAKTQLDTILDRRSTGDIDDKWKNWYAIANRRQNNGFPSYDMLNAIETNLTKMTL
ncbi:Glycosyl hydrolase family 115 [Maribacter dokdonensis]|uniref:Glycosyl hydrolase family 115 n=1 Tax=Maribacter dokdonensis TaxID=320912 RepID=A0ABY0UN58_9FLAO|nr:glycosyl hydrolase 115 family protein [Maribacter dokdonensis]SDS93534.1 Glycosyl hydrolase family 115 [Maribacter dokdonensis]